MQIFDFVPKHRPKSVALDVFKALRGNKSRGVKIENFSAAKFSQEASNTNGKKYDSGNIVP